MKKILILMPFAFLAGCSDDTLWFNSADAGGVTASATIPEGNYSIVNREEIARLDEDGTWTEYFPNGEVRTASIRWEAGAMCFEANNRCFNISRNIEGNFELTGFGAAEGANFILVPYSG